MEFFRLFETGIKLCGFLPKVHWELSEIAVGLAMLLTQWFRHVRLTAVAEIFRFLGRDNMSRSVRKIWSEN